MITTIKTNSKPTLTELAIDYAKTRDLELRKEIVRKSRKYVKVTARFLLRGFPRKIVQLDDLICYGNIGLIKAIEDYDPSYNVKFQTYLGRKVRGHILDGLREIDTLKRIDRTRLKGIVEFIEDFRKKYEGNPKHEDYKKEWDKRGYPEESFDEFYHFILRRGNVIDPNESLIRNNYGNAIEKGELDEVPRIPSSKSLHSEEGNKAFESDLLEVPEKYRELLRLHVIEMMPLNRARKMVGYSSSSATEIKRRYTKSKYFFQRTREYLEL